MEWIPASERLPEYTDDYIVTVSVRNEFGYFEDIRTIRYEIYDGDKPYKRWCILNHELAEIIAWMPLPNPYRADEHSKYCVSLKY